MDVSATQLFRQALWEATCNVYEREMAENVQNAKCSRRHYANMRKILDVAVLPAANRKAQIRRRVIAALIAAVLLLTGCATYAYREEIKAFIETMFDDHVEVKYDDAEAPAASTTITEYYTLGYVPEGYELVSEIRRPITSKYIWENSEDEYMVFKQYTISHGLYVMDDDIKNSELITIGRYEIYYRLANANYYIWNDGIYVYQLILSEQLSEQELLTMIEELAVNP